MKEVRDEITQALVQINQMVIGKEEIVSKVLMAILAKGHILLEDVPGVGKTTMALAFAKTMELEQRRIQFTPDVLPSDVVGYTMITRENQKEIYKQGAVMCNLLLADEINRTSSKTQSALLEAMEEGRVTVDQVTREIKKPFIVIATQNPKGSIGTQLLPDSQLDRFMIQLSMGYPDPQSEVTMLKGHSKKQRFEGFHTIITREQLLCMQDEVDEVFIHDAIYEYIVYLLQNTRNNIHIEQGVSPRGGIALMKMAKAVAYCYHRDYVIPDDIKYIFNDVIGHRIILSSQARLDGLAKEDVLREVFEQTRIPRMAVS